MKKNIIIATIAVASAFILSVSCQKQEISVSENTNDSEIAAFTATIDQESTKTVLAEGSATNKSKVNWESTDKISIKGAEYTVSSIQTDATKATFSGYGATKEDNKYKAIYPSSLYKTDHFELPSIQTYAAGKFNAPMYAESETELLPFKNICGVLCFSLKGNTTDKVKYITIIANEGVCGKFTMNSDAKTLILSSSTNPVEYSRTVSLDCGKGIQLDNTTATNFYIYLPPNTYTAGMKIIITTTDSKVFEKITTASATIERNNIYTFNDWTLDFKVKPTLLSGEFTVGKAKTVKFTKGNLWADASGDKASAPVLHFEANQYGFNSDYSDNSHVSHFTWSDNVASAVSDSYSGSNLFCDESHKQTVDKQDGCYALSMNEWKYLFQTRANAAAKYCHATVNNIRGVMIFPDGTFNDPYAGIKKFNPTANAGSNKYSEAEWIAMESEGAVFLPESGSRLNSAVQLNGGDYWLSTPFTTPNKAYCLSFSDNTLGYGSGLYRYYGYSIRLITECQ